jgi:hypothetical protein
VEIASASDSRQVVPLDGNMSQTMGRMAGVSSCVTLAGHIMDLLMTAKGNKEEFRSLRVAVDSICSFLRNLPEDGITPQGSTVLRKWQKEAVWAV